VWDTSWPKNDSGLDRYETEGTQNTTNSSSDEGEQFLNKWISQAAASQLQQKQNRPACIFYFGWNPNSDISEQSSPADLFHLVFDKEMLALIEKEKNK
jgi:hypothetical protein